eukprot:GDKK01072283.1.p1 GENE.GDKK01072283.1~~GDKK01072283.1.p1  ORF type:complete len:158 (+),score=24.99 GDKK01072283.1:39-476(+)
MSEVQGTWDATSNSCSSIVTDITYEIVYAYTGDVTAPNKEIVAARSVHQRSSRIIFVPTKAPSSATAESDGVQRTTIVLTAHVNFERALQEANIETNLPPMPSISLKVPRDFFYPFVVADEESNAVSLPVFVGLGLALIGGLVRM